MLLTRRSIAVRIPPLCIALTVLAAGLAACDRPAPPQAQERPRPVRTIIVEASHGEQVLRLPGEVRPRVETRYGFRVNGKIAERLVSVGDPIKAGQTLARLDPRDVAPVLAGARSQVEAAATDLKLARIELDRLKDLSERGFVSAAQVDRQQAQTDASAARLRTAQAQLNEAGNAVAFQALKADAPGVVTAIDAEAGQVVEAGQPIVRVARTGEKELLVNVPEADLARAQAARDWTVIVSAAGARISARLRELSPVADPASRTYPMRLSLLGDIEAIALGMSAIAETRLRAGSEIVLPISALYSKDGVPRVWIVGDDLTVNTVPVRTDGMLDDAVRIIEGVSAGDRVVTAGANLLIEGQPVRLLDSDDSSSGTAR